MDLMSVRTVSAALVHTPRWPQRLDIEAELEVNKMKILGIALLSAFVIGCTSSPPVVTGPNHPANSDAAEAPAPAPSMTLATTEPAPQQHDAEAQAAPHDHAQHRMGDM